mgnify:CR=1 FL=1
MRRDERWRLGRTRGGALGVWTQSARMDSPNVCTVLDIPPGAGEERARLIASAPELRATLEAMCQLWLHGFGMAEGASPTPEDERRVAALAGRAVAVLAYVKDGIE